MGDALVRAVDDVTMSVAAGEFVALLGSSGSGKSTLLNLMAGLDRPTSGAIFAHERNLAEMNSDELARHRSHTIGIVFQSFNLLPRMTLEENVELPLRLAEVERGERTARVREAVDRVRLSGAADAPPERAFGRRAAASGAGARAGEPADHSAGGRADWKPRQRDRRRNHECCCARSTQTLGMTIVMVTHEQPRAERFAHRMILMGDGKIKNDGVRA